MEIRSRRNVDEKIKGKLYLTIVQCQVHCTVADEEVVRRCDESADEWFTCSLILFEPSRFAGAWF